MQIMRVQRGKLCVNVGNSYAAMRVSKKNLPGSGSTRRSLPRPKGKGQNSFPVLLEVVKSLVQLFLFKSQMLYE